MLIGIDAGDGVGRLAVRGLGLAEQSTNPREFFLTVSISEETVVANAHEVLGENVQEKTSKKLDGIEGHDAVPILAGVVLPAERDLGVVGGDEPAVGDGYAVGVASEVFEDLSWASERRLRVNDPGFVSEGIEPSVPCVGMAEVLKTTEKMELASVVGALE